MHDSRKTWELGSKQTMHLKYTNTFIRLWSLASPIRRP